MATRKFIWNMFLLVMLYSSVVHVLVLMTYHDQLSPGKLGSAQRQEQKKQPWTKLANESDPVAVRPAGYNNSVGGNSGRNSNSNNQNKTRKKERTKLLRGKIQKGGKIMQTISKRQFLPMQTILQSKLLQMQSFLHWRLFMRIFQKL